MARSTTPDAVATTVGESDHFCETTSNLRHLGDAPLTEARSALRSNDSTIGSAPSGTATGMDLPYRSKTSMAARCE